MTLSKVSPDAQTFTFEATTKFEIKLSDLTDLLITAGQGCYFWGRVFVNIDPRKPFKKQNFVKDSMLNNLLNETAAGDTNLESGHARMSMNPSFESAGVGDMPIEAVPESVANAVTRDYSDLMNAMKNKKR